MDKIGDALTNFNQNIDVKTALKSSYFKAKKNENFTHITSLLSLSEEELMKYTSKLEECAKEFTNCQNCLGLKNCNNLVCGSCFTPSVEQNKLVFSYNLCSYQKKENKKNQYQQNIYFFDIPKELVNASMKNIYIDDKNRKTTILWLEKFITNYPKNKKGLYLYGNFGCGKTYLITAMFNELAKNNIRSAIIYYPEFLRNIKASFNDFDEKFNIIKKIPLLLLDDIGAENMTAWSRDEVLGPLLQYRMQEELPTFFTSNLNLEDLEMHFSYTKDNVDKIKARRIMERIKYLSEYLELIGKNRR